MESDQKTIMVVEDEPDAADLFSEMMRISGHHVVKFLHSGPAMGALIYNRPDVVLLDIMMPDASGLDVLRFIRREPALAKLPVIVISAKTLPADIQIGLEAGATIYLTKPVNFQDLKKAVEQVLVGDSTHRT
jgi:CheY-like chemotaxis protein